MPAAEIRDLLPATMNAAAWQTLARLKEHWGTSIQALLYRARRLGVLSDVSYRNAMTTLTARGWRRNEPGLLTVLEQPSLLPRAVELLAQEAIGEVLLVQQCRVPADLFRTVTARVPLPAPPAPPTPATWYHSSSNRQPPPPPRPSSRRRGNRSLPDRGRHSSKARIKTSKTFFFM